MAESKNETGWIKLFEEHKIFESIQKKGSFVIFLLRIRVKKIDYKNFQLVGPVRGD